MLLSICLWQESGFYRDAGWDGKSDMLLPVTPIGAEDWYYHSEGRFDEDQRGPAISSLFIQN